MSKSSKGKSRKISTSAASASTDLGAPVPLAVPAGRQEVHHGGPRQVLRAEDGLQREAFLRVAFLSDQSDPLAF